MLADLAQKEAAKKLADRQFRWETWKALAGILVAVAVISGTVIALENYFHPSSQQTINVHLDAPLVLPAQNK